LKTVVIGIGNLLRCDDGAGVHVVNFLKSTNTKVDAHDLTMGSIDIIELIRGYDRAYIIDAIKTGAEPGTVFKINIHHNEEPPVIHSSHGVDLFTTLKLAEELYPEELPNEIIVFGIEAQDLITLNMECTEPVRKGVEQVAQYIQNHL
jgi:hydrogenase maturation protease